MIKTARLVDMPIRYHAGEGNSAPTCRNSNKLISTRHVLLQNNRISYEYKDNLKTSK